MSDARSCASSVVSKSSTAKGPVSGTSSKTCKSCGETKPETKFQPNGKKKDGSSYRTASCRDCNDLKRLEKGLKGSVVAPKEPSKNDIMKDASAALLRLIDSYHPDHN